jgi:hypothetical protein
MSHGDIRGRGEFRKFSLPGTLDRELAGAFARAECKPHIGNDPGRDRAGRPGPENISKFRRKCAMIQGCKEYRCADDELNKT